MPRVVPGTGLPRERPPPAIQTRGTAPDRGPGTPKPYTPRPRYAAPMRVSHAVLLLAVGGLLLAAVPASADHVYSHRYLVYGRVVDADGMPLEGLNVQPDLSNFADYEGGCGQETRQQLTTDAAGLYYFCGHVHSSGSSTHQISVAVTDGQTILDQQTLSSDPDLRRSHVNFQLDDPFPDRRGDTDAFNDSYRLRGVIWQEEDTRLERVTVNGVTYNHEPVWANITTADGTTHPGTFVPSPFNDPSTVDQGDEHRGVTDTYGDFVFTWSNLPADLEGAEVTVVSQGETVTEPLDTTHRYHTSALKLPGPGPNLTVLWVIGGIIAAGVIGYFAYGPAKERWDEYTRKRRMRRLQEESDRKRS